MRELFLNLDLSVFDIIVLFTYMMPMMLLMVIPISCMFSIFLTFLRMSTERELIAVKAGGISVYQLLRSPAVFSALCMFLTFFISLHGISWGMESFRGHLLEVANTKARVVLQPGIFNHDLFGKTLFARSIDKDTGRLEQVLFEDKTTDGLTTMVFLAKEGALSTDEEKGEIDFTLFNGRVYQFSDTRVNVMHFKQYTVLLDLTKLLSGYSLKEVRPKEMPWHELLVMDALKNAPSKGYQQKVSVEIQKRLALPFSCIVLGLFALPVACAFEGMRRQYGVFLAMGMFLVYYSLFSLGITTGESGVLPPVIGLWIANAVFLIIGCTGLYFVGREYNPLTGIIQRFSFRKRLTPTSGTL